MTIPDEGMLGVQLGDGQGGMISTLYFPANYGATGFDIADLDLDGELDVVVTNKALNQFSILIGDGAGNFELSASFATNFGPNVVQVGHYNGDDILDIAVGTNDSISVYKGTISLTFEEMMVLPTAAPSELLRSGDFNSDGAVDLVLFSTSGNAGEMRIYLGLENFGFSLTATYSTIFGFTLADFDSDGKLDILASRFPENQILAFRGMGDGTFAEPIVTGSSLWQGAATMDYNDDGFLDLVTPGNIYIGDGTGHFTNFSRLGTAGRITMVEVADFNSDGRSDFATLSAPAGESTAVTFNNDGHPIRGDAFANTAQNAWEVDKADFNLDGRLDLVSIDRYNNSAYVFLQNAVGDFVISALLPLSGGFNVSGYSIRVADFNNDGKPDLVAPDSWTNKIVMFTGTGNGTFAKTIFPFPMNSGTPTSVRTGDFNGDGFVDVLALGDQSRSYWILLNDGKGGLIVLDRQFMGGTSTQYTAALGDFDQDGNLDMIITRPIDLSMLFFRGNGDGTFVAPIQIPVSHGINEILTNDFDGDGLLDLALPVSALINGTPASLKIMYGLPGGGFSPAESFPLQSSARDVEYQDFDMDGINDFVVVTPGNSSIEFIKGRGDRNFDAAIRQYVVEAGSTMTSGDFDMDGKPDVAFGRIVGSYVKVMYNDSNSHPCLSVNDVQIVEGNGGTSDVRFDITLSESSSETVSVNYRTVGRTARAGTDYVHVTGTVTFHPGVVSQSVDVTVIGDLMDENDETIVLRLEEPANAVIRDGVGVATIINEDLPPQLLLNDFSSTEGDTGSTIFSVPLGLSAASGRRIKFHVSSQDGTATTGSDYEAFSRNFFLEPGETSKNLNVPVVSDYVIEPDETFHINATSVVNCDPPAGAGTVTIINDDFGGNVQFSGGTYSVVENAGSVNVTVTRENGLASGITLQYSTNDGTAVAGQDYTAVSGTLTFGPGVTSTSFTIPILDDEIIESNVETINLSLSDIDGGATFGTPTTAVVYIRDDDGPGSGSFDYDGDRKTDISVFRPSDGYWYLQQSTDGFYAVNFGVAADKIVPADYDGDGKTDVAVYRPSTGIWYVVNSSDGTFTSYGFGIEEDLPAPADYDGDGKADITVFRPSTGTWYRQNSSDGSFAIVQFGTEGDRPTIGDFDGDGKADVAVFRPLSGVWYQLNSSDGSFFAEQFGISIDKIVPADYDGDGKTDVAIYRPADGLWYVKNSGNGTYTPHIFGIAEDIPVPGDYDGDGKADIAVFRPSNGHWYIANSSNATFTIFPWGQNGDQPTPSAFGN